MIELTRPLVVVAFATSAELDRNNLDNDPIGELNEHVTPENSLLVTRTEDGSYRLYCGGEAVEDFVVVGNAPYAVSARLHGEPVDIGNSAAIKPIAVDGKEYRTPQVFFTGDHVAEVDLVKAAGQPGKLANLRF